MQDFDHDDSPQTRTLFIQDDPGSTQQNIAVAKALASKPRLRILDCLVPKVASLSEIANELGMPLATASLHLSILEDAGLLSSVKTPGKRGQQRIYTRLYDTVVFNLPRTERSAHAHKLETQMPVGAFFDHKVVSPCGWTGTDLSSVIYDDPIQFHSPDRFAAQLVWLSHGYLEYRFPNHASETGHPKSLQLSAEICSEAAPSALDWPSDIFLEINRIRIGVWTSPSDFGDRRGGLTPAWWADWNTQYGLLKTWQVDEQGSSLDGRKISDVTISDLRLPERDYISVRIGIDDNAVNRGGLNIFGRGFGNHAQDIIMQLDYRPTAKT